MANANLMVDKRQTDWCKCCLCQMDKKDEFLVSAPILYVAEHDGYKMIATNVPLFYENNEMPMIMDLAMLDDNGGIEDTFFKNQAQYHRSCRLMFNNDKLGCTRKRKSNSQNNERHESHGNLCRTTCDVKAYIFCKTISPAHNLKQVMTNDLNGRLNECAKILNDVKLLVMPWHAQELKYYVSLVPYNRKKSHLRTLEKE